MQFVIDVSPRKYEGKTPQWVAKEIFITLENESVEVNDVKWIGDVKPKITGIRDERGKQIISVEI